MNSFKPTYISLVIAIVLISCGKPAKSTDDQNDNRDSKVRELMMKYEAIQLPDTSFQQYSISLNNTYSDTTLIFPSVIISDIYVAKKDTLLIGQSLGPPGFFLRIAISKNQFEQLMSCDYFSSLVVDNPKFKKFDFMLNPSMAVEYYEAGQDKHGDVYYNEFSYPIVEIDLSDTFVVNGELIFGECL